MGSNGQKVVGYLDIAAYTEECGVLNLVSHNLTRECTTPTKMMYEKEEENEPVISQRRDDAVDSPKMKAQLYESSELEQYILEEHDKFGAKTSKKREGTQEKLSQKVMNRIKVLEEEWAKKEVEGTRLFVVTI
ncbi:unnamed protein product [Albugo candida]|uniref:Uncharacterized protein n=1 Tax=Albugo candida TaxID=65357 RepID=A0A024GVT6_9STRA|nr:unnamed protein product [Albugo candida]|eukprot:CCI50537.1 unnamed protein product [Albugo candida]